MSLPRAGGILCCINPSLSSANARSSQDGSNGAGGVGYPGVAWEGGSRREVGSGESSNRGRPQIPGVVQTLPFQIKGHMKAVFDVQGPSPCS